jgi:hypothetical protein
MRKDTSIFSELQEFFQQNDSHRAIIRIVGIMRSLHIHEKQIGLTKKPNCKFTVLQVFHLLLLFPFFCIKDAFHYKESALGRVFSCNKDMFYRLMENDDVNWRNILDTINRQLITRLSVRTDSKKSGKPVCIVADDTDLPKTGKHMELMGRVHSHVLGISRLGFKGLFLARTGGKTQTILDVAVLGEEGKDPNKPHGMTKEQISKQYTKERDKESCGQQRKEEYDIDKQTMLRNMITHVIKKGQRFDYLLIDSWFTCKELVHYIKRRHFVCHLLGMIKMGKTKYHTEQYGDLTAKVCIDKLKRVKKGIKYSRALKCYYGTMDVTFDGVQVRLFFCRMGKHGKWRGLLTTNLTINFFEAYRIYAMRWCIEVSFEEMKGLLGLGKCQARNFTAQIASVTLTIIQYNILCYAKRFDSYETIGGLFGEVTTGTAEMTIVDKIWNLIVEVVTEIAEQVSADYMELMHAAISGNSHLHHMFVHEYAKLEIQKFTCES